MPGGPNLPTLAAISPQSSPVQHGAIPLLPCPLECGQGPWQSHSSLFLHVNHHLQQLQDVSVFHGWASSARRWICPSCHLLCPQRRPCGTCRKPFSEGSRPQADSYVSASLVVEDWDDSIWHSLLLHPQPVLRAIPSGARAIWLSGLVNELDHLRHTATATAVQRFAVFCRIVLAPLGRGGEEALPAGHVHPLRPHCTLGSGPAHATGPGISFFEPEQRSAGRAGRQRGRAPRGNAARRNPGGP